MPRLKRFWYQQTRRFRTVGVLTGVMLAIGLAVASLPTAAHPDPAECNASGLQQFPSVGPAGNVYDGSTLTYSVIYINSDPDGAGAVAPCNITGADAMITRPDGSVINVLTDVTLNVGDSISCPGDAECSAGPYQYVVNHANENGSSSVQAQFDIAGVLHQDADEEVASDHDTLSKTVIHPSTMLTKQADQTLVTAGSSVTYTYTEDNDGDVALDSPSVVDDMCAPVTYVSGDTNVNGDLDTDETWTFTCTMVVNANTTNTAIGRGLDPLGNNITWCVDPQSPPQGVRCDQDERAQASVRVVTPLSIEKTVNTTYDRGWTWSIDKSANQTALELAEGEAPVGVNYAVMVSAVSADMNHMVSGTITITNPADNPMATITDVTDVMTNIGAATVDCTGDASFTAFPHNLAANATLTCAYTKAAPDGDSETNTATVTTSGDVPGNSVNAAVTFGAPANEIDECIIVGDTNSQGPQGVVVCAGDAPQTFNYVVTFGNHPDANVFVECGETDYPNTARFVTNDTQTVGQDNWNVHITVNCFQGCTLTQGYWKTHSDRGPAPFDDNWNNLGNVDGDGSSEQESENFFLSGMTWYQVFWTAPKGNAYYLLAHQYMAAVLNTLNGASVPANVQTALNDAATLFTTYTPAQVGAWKGNNATRQQFITLAGTLGSYNEGLIGPGHCDE